MPQTHADFPSLEQGILPLDRVAPGISLPKEDPYAQARALLLGAMESYSAALSHQAAPEIALQDIRRDLALLRRADTRQAASLAALAEGKESPGGQALRYAMLSLETAAGLAQPMKAGGVRQALDFIIPEYLDELYRLANLVALTEGISAHQVLAGHVEIMPGRPLIACHRHPYDEVRVPLPPHQGLTAAAPLIMAAVEEAKKSFYLAAVRGADAPSRDLYLELSLLSEQHQTHFASLLPGGPALERVFWCQWAEGYLYASCAAEEENPALRQFYRRERDIEISHIRKLSDLLGPESPAIPDFPPPLHLGHSKGYVRDTLQQAGVTALRERYVPVGTLPPGADYFRYQKRVCPREEAVPSHRIVEMLMEKTGEDYRFEIAPHPVQALRNRKADDTRVGRGG